MDVLFNGRGKLFAKPLGLPVQPEHEAVGEPDDAAEGVVECARECDPGAIAGADEIDKQDNERRQEHGKQAEVHQPEGDRRGRERDDRDEQSRRRGQGHRPGDCRHATDDGADDTFMRPQPGHGRAKLHDHGGRHRRSICVAQMKVDGDRLSHHDTGGIGGGWAGKLRGHPGCLPFRAGACGSERGSAISSFSS